MFNLGLYAFLSTSLQGAIHLLKSLFGIPIQARTERPDQKPAETLALPEAYLILAQRLDHKSMLTIKDAGNHEAAQPSELAFSIRNEHDG